MRLPRRTVRLRLTLLYGALFLVSGAMLLAITYLLVWNGTAESHVTSGTNESIAIGSPSGPPDRPAPPEVLTPEPASHLDAQALLEQRGSDLRQFLTQSGIALAIMSVISILLGWVVAGRLLNRLSTITRTAQHISVTNLHERLALHGPDDELKQLGDTIDGLLARLEAAFRSQRQFVANASHELRTPLARQRTVAQVALADQDASVESLRDAHERVLAAGRQQERLIEALLTLARSEGGIDRREPIDLAAVTREVLLARHPEVQHRGLRIDTMLEPARASGDPRLVEGLVTNLVDNAISHNVPAGHIRVTTTVRSGQSTLSVSNTGPVVPESEVDRLFQPFQQLGADRTRHDGGHGLGLSIVHAIAAAHDGTVEATPLTAGGLLITVTFPPPPPPLPWLVGLRR